MQNSIVNEITNAATNRGGVYSAFMLIDGEWTKGSSSQRLEVENPANEQIIATIPEGTEQDGLDALESAKRAQAGWSAMTAIDRAKLISLLADEVSREITQLAHLVTLEQGKPLNQATEEIRAVEMYLRYSAENARRIEGDIITSDISREEIWIHRVPHGVVVGLTAWNYPSALAARKFGPALVAGNTFVLLAHEITPLSGIELARLALKVGIPKGVFNVVTGRGQIVGQAMVKSPLSNLVTMTGSTRAGKEIYRTGADTLKIVRLELGGKAPFIVMDDADIDAAVQAAITSRYANCGQICTCNERMYLHSKIADEFLEKFIAGSKALVIGDPMASPDMGPKVSGVEVNKITEMVDRGVAGGAKVLLKGGPLNEAQYSKGHWYAPTILEVDSNSSSLMQEEIFGPVVPAMRVQDFEEAVSLANETDFGLSAYLFTQDLRRLMRISTELKFGEIYFNRANGEQVHGFHNGWGHSGLGGEDGKYGFDGYLRKQTTYVNWA